MRAGRIGSVRCELAAPERGSVRLHATFFEENEAPSGSSTRSDLQVDGADAYTPTTARYLEEDLTTTIHGAPRLSVTEAFDRTSGLLTIHALDPLVKCSPGASFHESELQRIRLDGRPTRTYLADEQRESGGIDDR